MPSYTVKRDHIVNTTIEELWAFISNPNNLEVLTPKKFGGKRIGDVTVDKIQEGLESTYKVKLLPFVSMKWVAKYSDIKRFVKFTDTQISGPFKSWQHKHSIISHRGNVIMLDEITFEPPIPIIGKFIYKNFILKRLHQLFNYRDQKLDTIFPKQSRRSFVL
jgi:ligand-binding SRPBCC domain-containing protein